MAGLPTTFNVVTDDCDEEIFHKTSHGAFHTSMFTRIVAITEDISFLTGKYKSIKKPLLFEVYTIIPLRIMTHIYHAS